MIVNLLIVLGICVVIVVLGNAFVGEGLKWFKGLAKPKVLVPMSVFLHRRPNRLRDRCNHSLPRSQCYSRRQGFGLCVDPRRHDCQ